MDASSTQSVAQALLHARRHRSPVDAAALAGSLREPQDAYEVQRLVREALAPGELPAFWKSGGPSRSAVLTHAPLFAASTWPSPADARNSHFNSRLIEAEVALRLGSDVTAAQAARLTPGDAAALVDAMAVAIEIVDSRWTEGVDAPPLLKLADLQSHGALVVGEWRRFAARDWAMQSCVVRIAASSAEYRGTHPLGDPTWLLPAWLKHATRGGAVVRAGTSVTTGTWCGMLPANRGDRVSVTFDGIGAACVEL
ncbi:fumarylacetoacetate hydrolase family protein [Ramlibacter tataouinensis]|uniref:fumarylacetoacetate hydrolase family protein n=1 Tax=Ramlibacter tataouinensis TaxID=94132 RepID=UPI0022F37DA4|nr:fumarylacetoacetate hydrolase family protein [Ramlibacter tataouinensis]WBY01220.1 fumarylacetoacetate hydrolase family protein [Ramlibacter tataouinensis]